MTEKGMENNKVTVIGTIVSGFTFSHAVFGEGFYLVDLLVNRLSEQADKIITFDKGIIGFPELKHFTMLHDEEKGSSAGIRYLQSIEEPSFAMPVMDPLLVTPDYDPADY